MFNEDENFLKIISEIKETEKIISSNEEKKRELNNNLHAIVANLFSKNLDKIDFSRESFDFRISASNCSCALYLHDPKDPILKILRELYCDNLLTEEKFILNNERVYLTLYSSVIIHFDDPSQFFPFVKRYNIKINTLNEIETFLEKYHLSKSSFLKLENIFNAFNMKEIENKKGLL